MVRQAEIEPATLSLEEWRPSFYAAPSPAIKLDIFRTHSLVNLWNGPRLSSAVTGFQSFQWDSASSCLSHLSTI
jgi:hypothetical protein